MDITTRFFLTGQSEANPMLPRPIEVFVRAFCAFIALSIGLNAQSMRGLYTNLKVSGSNSEDGGVVATLKANRYLDGVLVSVPSPARFAPPADC